MTTHDHDDDHLAAQLRAAVARTGPAHELAPIFSGDRHLIQSTREPDPHPGVRDAREAAAELRAKAAAAEAAATAADRHADAIDTVRAEVERERRLAALAEADPMAGALARWLGSPTEALPPLNADAETWRRHIGL